MTDQPPPLSPAERWQIIHDMIHAALAARVRCHVEPLDVADDEGDDAA